MQNLTPSQQRAVLARGNVLVMAGAGTGKTHTLVERALHLLTEEKNSIEEILIVTFTEAAAAEMRSRLHNAIEKKSESGSADFWREQLALFDLAHIGTLHSFCFKLIRENFHRLGLDPQLSILDEGATFQLAAETLDEQFTAHYENKKKISDAVQNLIQTYGHGRDEKIRELILRLHHYSQTRPDAELWLAEQIQNFSATESAQWREQFFSAVENWRDEWLPVLENLKSENEKAAELFLPLKNWPKNFPRETAAQILSQIISADNIWPAKRKTILREPLKKIFDDAKFLNSFARVENGVDPLAQDWDWIRGHMKTLLQLAQEFAEKFSARKRGDAVLDFHDLEQFALKLLREPDVTQKWREKFRFIFVDEYQDINAAQDKIIQCLSGENENANRFLVGDVKQSIYRFRLANPKIFRDYAKNWPVAPKWNEGGRGEIGQTIPLSENFRSREPLLNFVNSLFALLMREEIGGVNYDADAHLKFGERDFLSQSAADILSAEAPRSELLLRIQNRVEEISDENSELANLEESQKEARMIANRLQELISAKNQIWDDKRKKVRAVEWRDIAILLRSPRGKAEIFAQEFSRAQIPLIVARGGFFDSSEILDLLSLLELLDNPLQDVPCISVLRSPFVGLSLDELAEIRLLAHGHFWFALNEIKNSKLKIKNETRAKVEKFLERFFRWRKLAQQSSLSECLETILAETHYDDWLKSRPRGAQRSANVAQLLNHAQRFDEFQRQGLFRFLKFIEAQREAEVEPEVPAVAEENAARLMSIHQSKGLEFPVVVVADLGKNFNEQDLRAEIIFDEELGLCPRVQPPQTGARYSSLPHWLVQKNQRRQLRGEELRLLYVALTRARDKLILTANISQKSWEKIWQPSEKISTQKILGAKSFADWIGIWFAQEVQSSRSKVQSPEFDESKTQGEFEHLSWRIVDDLELGSARVARAVSGVAPETSIDESDSDFSEKEIAKRDASQSTPEACAPQDLNAQILEKLREVLDWKYEFEAATRRAAKSSVTALRRETEALDDEAEKLFSNSNLKFYENSFVRKFSKKNRPSAIGNRPLNASEIGAAHHKFLELVALEKTGDLAAEAERLARENFLSSEEKSVLNLKSLAAFWNSEIGKKIAAQSKFVKRELQFTARFSPAEIEKIIGPGKEKIFTETGSSNRQTPNGIENITFSSADKMSAALLDELENEFVVVQGVADLVVILPNEIWLVDFKTDDFDACDLLEKIKIYSPQLQLYAAALEKIYSRPVTMRALHFLSAQRTIEI